MIIKRALRFIFGVFFTSLGIVLCKKCALGISPVSSIPYVLSLVVPCSFGQLTICFHLLNTAVQLLIVKKVKIKLLLQAAFALVFGTIVDLLDSVIYFNSDLWYLQLLILALSVISTALGMALTVQADIVQNPPDGTVERLSGAIGISLGRMKIIYDISCVAISLAISLAFLHHIEGFGPATIISALFVGRCVNVIKQRFFRKAAVI